MENASKALIIAGAILISILLISVGIIIMNAINDPVQQGAGAAESQAIEMFNAKFVGYDGKQKGSSLKTLVSTVNASNGKDTDHQVALTYSTTDVTKISQLDANKEYEVDVVYATKNGENTYTGAQRLDRTGTSDKKIQSDIGYVCEIKINHPTTKTTP